MRTNSSRNRLREANQQSGTRHFEIETASVRIGRVGTQRTETYFTHMNKISFESKMQQRLSIRGEERRREATQKETEQNLGMRAGDGRGRSEEMREGTCKDILSPLRVSITSSDSGEGIGGRKAFFSYLGTCEDE